jgi:hypothetical protein
MRLGAIKGKMPEELGPMPMGEGEGEMPLGEEGEEMLPDESMEPVDLAGIPDEVLMEEIKKRGLV